jgi:hypothetical protein
MNYNLNTHNFVKFASFICGSFNGAIIDSDCPVEMQMNERQ